MINLYYMYMYVEVVKKQAHTMYMCMSTLNKRHEHILYKEYIHVRLGIFLYICSLHRLCTHIHQVLQLTIWYSLVPSPCGLGTRLDLVLLTSLFGELFEGPRLVGELQLHGCL